MTLHIPVLLESVLCTLGDISGLTIIDGTFGAGGYSRAFLERGANVIAFDRDVNVIKTANDLGAKYPNSFKFVLSKFSKISDFICTPADAIVFDFGISSMQIDNGERGFSFRFDGPLDMRMSDDGMTAADLIESLSVRELAKILSDYGDVKKAAMFADIIKKSAPKTTYELKNLINNPKDVPPIFQALRIAVNNEIGEIQIAINSVPELLNQNGKCICVTFHSLEDRLIKSQFRAWTDSIGDPHMPEIEKPRFKLLKTFRPSDFELVDNPRARSAHLRGVQKSY